ncbi:conserved hypothetical protein [Tenacibaculum maritimum]|uniref:hypothetical protein n=1 Tax=Tenacibaculum maritimum TaxID=107401 RepID=UPI0012E534CC|nr:hypothetical protein [Tenacibaculum maritimum]CAA0178232.1 conserved hypothetical protein [Tenacibaculum maritimum]
MKFSFSSIFKKPINSASDEITSKFKTPFFTTYLIVWGLKNNLFIYNLFFNNKIENKSKLLQTQFNFSEFSFYKDIFITLIVSLIVLIIFYVFLNISRSITILSEERIKLNLLSFLKSKSLSSIDDTTFWKDKTDILTKTNRELEDEISTLRSSNKFYKENYETEQKKVEKTIKNSDEAILRIKKIVDEFSKDISKSEHHPDLALLDFIKSIQNEYQRYEDSKKPPSFLRV